MRTCLVVDGSRVTRLVARKIVEELGFAVTEASDGKTALEACGAAMPDAVLLDWNLSIVSGVEFLRVLRAASGGDKPVVMFCTSEGGAERMAEALREGADEYIVKPFDSGIVRSKFLVAGLL